MGDPHQLRKSETVADSEGAGHLAVLVAARNEANTIGPSVTALKTVFPGAVVWVGDDGSDDGTAELAMAAGARVISRHKPHGKGGNMTACAEAMLSDPVQPSVVLLGFSAWVIKKRCGAEPIAPISGQRAMRPEVLRAVLPFAPKYGMETGMTIDAVRAGYRLGEYELDLAHRATGRTFKGFVHRFRQMLDFAKVYVSRRPRKAGK